MKMKILLLFFCCLVNLLTRESSAVRVAVVAGAGTRSSNIGESYSNWGDSTISTRTTKWGGHRVRRSPKAFRLGSFGSWGRSSSLGHSSSLGKSPSLGQSSFYGHSSPLEQGSSFGHSSSLGQSSYLGGRSSWGQGSYFGPSSSWGQGSYFKPSFSWGHQSQGAGSFDDADGSSWTGRQYDKNSDKKETIQDILARLEDSYKKYSTTQKNDEVLSTTESSLPSIGDVNFDKNPKSDSERKRMKEEMIKKSKVMPIMSNVPHVISSR
uniref:Uncharacterized protein n=1 Tax=Cacopsylla melanoneura TaxID=428564 RepID=A0A8D8XLY4_9HEMI